MRAPIKKIITASAGTGKTYRLSLEYINLLLQYRDNDIGFDEILVITFTRKATYEIRTAIIEHLQNLICGNDEGILLQDNMLKLFNRKIGQPDLIYLRRIYEQMLVNKHKLQISTIDSFINSVFKTVIAPYIGITSFSIDNEVNSKYLPLLYNHIFSDREDSESFIRIFKTAGRSTVEQYDSLILSIIENRWLLHLISEINDTTIESERENSAQEYLTTFLEQYKELALKIYGYFTESYQGDTTTDLKTKDFVRKFFVNLVQRDDLADFVQELLSLVSNEQILCEHMKDFSKNLAFWNNAKIRRKDSEFKDEIMRELENIKQFFCLYLFYKYLIPEEKEILKLAGHILDEYDRLKMRDKVFTHADITYYTFKYMYEPELSMIDPLNGSVSNRFYEYLSSRTRFMLIDEFQDTGIIQHKLLYPIISEIISGSGSREYGGVIIVGDEKQSIYGWRGGERDLLLNMPFIIASEDSSSLDTTYRSTRFMTGFINKVFGNIAANLKTCGLNWNYDPAIESHSKVDEGYLSFSFMNISRSSNTSDDIDILNPCRTFVETEVLPLYETGEINPARSVILARNNKYLKDIAAALEEYGIDFYLESSFSFLHHQIIRPIIHLLRFVSEQNLLFLLRFLRSDYCLMPGSELKEIALLQNRAANEEKSIIQILREEFQHNRIIEKTIHVLEEYSPADPISFITAIIQEFNVTGLFPEDHNIKNLHLFLDQVAEFFMQISSDYTKNITGLLSFLSDNEKNEEFRQASLENVDSLQLMTIHKAKGLEFDHVFLYYNTGGSKGNFSGNLDFLYRFNETYTDLEEYRISYNFSFLLKELDYSLQKEMNNRKALEELNNIYVALTRAKSSLSLFLIYQNKDGLLADTNKDADVSELSEQLIRKLFLNTIVRLLNLDEQVLRDQGELDKMLIIRKIGSPRTLATTRKTAENIQFPYSRFISLQRNSLMVQPEFKKDEMLNYKTVYLVNSKVLYGDLTHFYLSYIKYGSDDELEYARKRTVARYGNLITEDKIQGTIEKIESFILTERELFSRKWQTVFNELTVFDFNNREYRIDRLQIDKVNKIILIIDYKTGSVKETEQLEKYRNIVSGIPVVKQDNYRIEIRYVDVEI